MKGREREEDGGELNSWMWVSRMSGWWWNKGWRSHRGGKYQHGGAGCVLYTPFHLFLCYGFTLALSYFLILLKPELRFLTPCPTCVHIIFMQQHPLSCVCVRVCMCVCEVCPYTAYGTDKNDYFWSQIHRHGLSLLSTQLLSLKPKLETDFMRTEENTKQQLDEIFKCAING